MSWKLYLDDIRTLVDESFVIARSAEEAKRLILRKDMPSCISFDHDLGMDEDGNLLPSGYDFAKWLVELDIKGVIQIPDDFTFKVHSQNPVVASNIKGLLDGYLREIYKK